MKIILLVICLYLFSISLPAQSFFTIGANYSVQSYTHNLPFGKQKLENFKLSPSVGYGYHFHVKEKWSYEPGIYLGDLGGINDATFEPKVKFYIYAASLNQYVNYKPINWLSIGISPSVNYIVYAGITGKRLHVDSHGSVFSNDAVTSWKEFPSHELNRFIFSIVPRVAFHIKERWSLDLFYRNDLNSVGYPVKFLNYNLKGYGVGINLKYQLKTK